MVIETIYRFLISPIGIIIVFVISLTGFLYSIASYYRKDKKLLSFDILPLFALAPTEGFKELGIITTFNARITNDLVGIIILIKNCGKIDISRDELIGPIKISLKEGFQILKCSIAKVEKKLVANLSLEDNKALLYFDLLKPKEYIAIEMLFEVNSKIKFLSPEILCIDARIKGLNDQIIELGHPIERKLKEWRAINRFIYPPISLIIMKIFFPEPNQSVWFIPVYILVMAICIFILLLILKLKYMTETPFLLELRNQYKVFLNTYK
jgi:hypothetical protein